MRLLLIAVLLAATLAGCTDAETPDTEPAPSEMPGPSTEINETTIVDVVVRTTGTYPVNPGYDATTIEVAAGATVNLTFYNDETNSVSQHDWVIDEIEGAATDRIAPGEMTNIVFVVPDEPGEYSFYCSVGDHRARGMEGTLVVV